MDDKVSHWISISDMMAGIMMIFLLIAISFMVVLQSDKNAITSKKDKMHLLAKNYSALQLELYHDLLEEFSKDLKNFDALILEDTTIRFLKPESLFDVGDDRLKDRFKKILRDFFPRYIKILKQEKYNGLIEEIRIEGHTSKEWQNSISLEKRYLGNAQLSQERAFSVLKYCFSLKEIKSNQEWLIPLLRANGVSFAKPLSNPELSRRVEFKVEFKANKRIKEILEVGSI